MIFVTKKILFVNGPSQDTCDRFFGWPTPFLYAIAPTVAAIKAGELNLEYAPKMFDPIWYAEGKNDTKVKKDFIKQLNGVDVVCASATYDSLYPTMELFSEAKRINSNIKTILGGPHFDETHNLARFNQINLSPELVDFGIAGDGELALKTLLETIAKEKIGITDFSSVPGKAWIYSKKGRQSTSGVPLELDSLPFMPIELVDVERHKHDFDIFKDSKGIVPTFQMIAARGCSYSCDFCSERRELAYSNARSIENIVQEIQLRKEQGFRAIFFDDSTFGLYPKLKELLRALSKTGITFGSLNRFNHLNKQEIVEACKNAGFVYFYCAIEQFDDKALTEMKKRQGTQKIAESMKLLSRNKLMVGVSLLYGLPYETEESIKATLGFTEEWVTEGTIKLVSESILSYHPATPMGKNLKQGFNQTPPNKGFPFNQFEEGQWYHPKHVTAEYLKKILRLSEEKFSKAMVRKRHSWYATHGFTID